MCTNFEPYLDPAFREVFGAEMPVAEFKLEAWSHYEAPIVREIVKHKADDPGGREAVAAQFGLIPPWFRPDPAKPDKIKPSFATHNARFETIGELPTFRHAWTSAQYCLIPTKAFYEPCWETGKSVRMRISLKSGKPFAIAGIWERWRGKDQEIISFSMVTVDAVGHEVMEHMHKGKEKRMPVILEPEDYDRWLKATPEEAFQMCRQFPAELMMYTPAPIQPRTKKKKPDGPSPPSLL